MKHRSDSVSDAFAQLSFPRLNNLVLFGDEVDGRSDWVFVELVPLLQSVLPDLLTLQITGCTLPSIDFQTVSAASKLLSLTLSDVGDSDLFSLFTFVADTLEYLSVDLMDLQAPLSPDQPRSVLSGVFTDVLQPLHQVQHLRLSRHDCEVPVSALSGLRSLKCLELEIARHCISEEVVRTVRNAGSVSSRFRRLIIKHSIIKCSTAFAAALSDGHLPNIELIEFWGNRLELAYQPRSWSSLEEYQAVYLCRILAFQRAWTALRTAAEAAGCRVQLLNCKLDFPENAAFEAIRGEPSTSKPASFY